jgi:hypothetical protein
MNGKTQERPVTNYFGRLVGLLALDDQRMNEKAAEVFCRLGRLSRELLIREVRKPGKTAEHRNRILDVVERIGGPLGVDEFFDCQQLLHSDDPVVRSKVEKVLWTLSPCGPPKTPQAEALFRALHPAYWNPPKRRCRRKWPASASDLGHKTPTAARRPTKSPGTNAGGGSPLQTTSDTPREEPSRQTESADKDISQNPE